MQQNQQHIKEPVITIQEDLRQSQIAIVKPQRNSVLISEKLQKKYKFDGLTEKTAWAFAQGHFFNDMEGAIWFNFCPFFMVAVLGKEHIVPYALLLGQVFDGLMSPLVGIYSEKTQTKYGSRIPWYFWGNILIILCTVPMYMIILPETVPVWFDYAYYIFLPVTMNLGGCIVLIIHMSLVPTITCSRNRRDTLNARRNTFSFAANLFVLILALVIFQVTDNSLNSFWWICLICKLIGVVSIFYFLKHVNEPELVAECKKCVKEIKEVIEPKKKGRIEQFQIEDQKQDDDEDDKAEHWTYWFKQPIFYQIGVIYMCARVYFNMVAVIILFYCVHTLKVIDNPKDLDTQQMPFNAAVQPLIMWIGSVISSSQVDKAFVKYGKKKVLSVGMIVVLIITLGYYLMTPQTRLFMYPISFITGLSSAIILNTGITLIGEVVGNKSSGNTFVYGIYCLCDKTATGLVLYFACSPKFDSDYVRQLMVKTPLYTALIMWAVLMITPLQQEKQIQENLRISQKQETLLEQQEKSELKQLKDEFVQ